MKLCSVLISDDYWPVHIVPILTSERYRCVKNWPYRPICRMQEY